VAEAAGTMDDSGHRGRLDLEVSDRVCPTVASTRTGRSARTAGSTPTSTTSAATAAPSASPTRPAASSARCCEWEVTAATYQEVDLNDAYRSALETVGERESAFEILKGVQGLTSRNKTPEPIEKGVLRAKNGVTSFKDGTVRYDMTDLPVTSVRAEELDITADHLREIGYETDIDGEPLRHDDQLVELRVQDIVLSDGAAEHMLKTAGFVDDLLEQFYGLDRFYEFNERDDLVGELVFGWRRTRAPQLSGEWWVSRRPPWDTLIRTFTPPSGATASHPETEIEYRDDAGWHRTARPSRNSLRSD